MKHFITGLIIVAMTVVLFLTIGFAVGSYDTDKWDFDCRMTLILATFLFGWLSIGIRYRII